MIFGIFLLKQLKFKYKKFPEFILSIVQVILQFAFIKMILVIHKCEISDLDLKVS